MLPTDNEGGDCSITNIYSLHTIISFTIRNLSRAESGNKYSYKTLLLPLVNWGVPLTVHVQLVFRFFRSEIIQINVEANIGNSGALRNRK